MKTLTHPVAPTLFDRDITIKHMGQKFKFDTELEAKRFCRYSDIALISKEIAAVRAIRYYRSIPIAKEANDTLLQAYILCKGYGKAQNLSEIVSFIQNDVAPALDVLQSICAKESRSIIDQAKCLVILFITKYK